MKNLFVKISMVMAVASVMTLSFTLSGCGKHEDAQDQNTVNPTSEAPTPLPPPPNQVNNPNNTNVSQNIMPVGCYQGQFSSCAPCPINFIQQDQNTCIRGENTNQYCGQGWFWNGGYCQQIGYYPQAQGCPWGTTWSYYYYSCVGYGSSYSSYQYQTKCKYKRYLGGLAYTYICS